MANAKRNPRILWTIVLSFCLLFAVSYGGRLATKAYLERTIAQQTARIAEAKQRQQTLQQQMAYVRSDAYVEEVARNELGLVQPGDELLVVVARPQPRVAENPVMAAPVTVAPPFWQAWLQRLGF